MNDFKLGEIVDITIKGARVIGNDATPTYMAVSYLVDEARNDPRGPGRGQITINPSAPGVAVERVAPADWPPQEKDVWRDHDGDDWYGVLVDDDDTSEGPYVALLSGRTSKRCVDDEGSILAQFGPFTLVYREATT